MIIITPKSEITADPPALTSKTKKPRERRDNVTRPTGHKITRMYEDPTELTTRTDMPKTLWKGVRKGGCLWYY